MDSRPSNSGMVGCLLLEGAARTGTARANPVRVPIRGHLGLQDSWPGRQPAIAEGSKEGSGLSPAKLPGFCLAIRPLRKPPRSATIEA